MGVRRELLGERDFLIYFVSSFVSNVGTFAQSLGVPFVLYDLTKSYTWVGIGTLANWASSLLVTPIAGTLSDRLSRRMLLVWSNSVQLLAAAALWLMARHDVLTPWRTLGPLVLGGLGAGFQYSPSQALMPVLVPSQHRVAGMRMYNVQFTAARAIGPALAGVILHEWGVTTTFGVNALSFVAVIAGLLVIHEPPRERVVNTEPWRQQFAEGARYIWERDAMRRGVLSMFVVGACGSGVMQLVAGIAKGVYHLGKGGLGLMATAFGIGASLCSIFLLAVGPRLRRSHATLIGMAAYAAGVGLVAATRVVGVGVAGFVLMGIGHVSTGTSVSTSLHAQVDDRYRGRLASFFLIAVLGGSPFGALLWGRLGDSFGLRLSLAIAASTLGLYVLFVIVRFGALSVLDSNVDPAPAAPTVRPAERTVPAVR